ncbi:hypothetical protein KC19_11G032800 [Ceratodon purpureus]|uniref:Bromo domain-containing protein n=1 Tax=Ceratodon purpureus TaxID=3225 RepID=A0A8T0GAG0_CERPU|nr:hypothetical protein KC19_11G032800 [Ceratodon purpureus]
MQPREENVVVPKEFNLSGVLHSLMSLDPKGDFMGLLDGSSATDHSKVIEASICFAMMQEKIRTRQYSTWRMFVEDFEWICYNALKCNHKRSIIWAAANNLLRRGKKRLEQYERWGESLVALNKTGGSYASFDSKLGLPTKLKSENVEGRVCQHNKYPVTEGLKMAIPGATTGSPENKPPSSGAALLCRDATVGKDTCSMQRSKEEKREDQIARNTTSFLAPVLGIVSEGTSNVCMEARDIENSHRVLEVEPDNRPLGVLEAEEVVDLEGEGDDDSGDYRGGLDGDATESSSSYDSAGSALESDVDSDWIAFEADSLVLRDGNGAGGLMEDEDGLRTNERATKALDTDWKQSRRGIEWRCHWLELRTKLIKSKLRQYDESLRSLQNAKIWKWEGGGGEGSSARTLPVKVLRNHPVVHRKHRRRAEDAEDLDLGRHPVFSRYEKKKNPRKSDDGIPQGKVDSQHVQQTGYESDEPEGTFERQPVAGSALVRQNSMESILFLAEAVQARARKALHTLRKDAAPSRNAVVPKTGKINVSPLALPHSSQRNTSSAQEVNLQLFSIQTTPAPKAIPRGVTLSPAIGGTGRTGSGLARRKSSGYDIDDMVMPQGAGTAHVEKVRHVDIETPQWRLIEDAEQPGPESSSDEDTTDEHFRRRHAEMETDEHEQRSVIPVKKSASATHTVGKGRLKLGKGKGDLKGKGNSANLALPSIPDPSVNCALESILALPPDSVPKRQRTKSVRRPAVHAQTRYSDVIVKHEVKSEVDPPGVESSDAAEDSPTSPSMDED